MHLPNGTLLRGGTYKIVRFIANGGFGCTYEALHPLLGKRVAIKEFFPETICNRDPNNSNITVGTLKQKPLVDKLKKKFINEAGAIAQLSHPGIVKVSDVFEENGTAYYVMDYIDGQSLNKIIAERGTLSENEALHYIRQVCDALEFVHSKNRLHLDIKPGNIMVDNEGRAILIDFGASRQYDEENGENTSTLVGKTPGYAPIEQMGNDVSGFKPATDIYALGATFYKCLTGKTPLESTQLANGDELDPLPSNVSESTKKAISAAMQVASKKRPQSIEEFLSILNQSHNNDEDEERTFYDTPKKKPSSPSNKKVEEKSGYETPIKPIKVTDPIKQNSSNHVNPSVSSNNRNSDSNKNDADPDTTKSSKTKIYLGIAAAVVIALLCLMVFGGKGSAPTNREGEEIAIVVDSLENSDAFQSRQELEGVPITTEDKSKLDEDEKKEDQTLSRERERAVAEADWQARQDKKAEEQKLAHQKEQDRAEFDRIKQERERERAEAEWRARQEKRAEEQKLDRQKDRESAQSDRRFANGPVQDVVSPSRTLTIMAADYYGSSYYWVYIYQENPNLGNPTCIENGTKVNIPPLSKYVQGSPNDPKNIQKAINLGENIRSKYK